MKWNKVRRGTAALAAGVLLTGVALAASKGESLISLSYLNQKFIPSLVAQGNDIRDKQLNEAYQSALRKLEQTAGGQTEGTGGPYSPDLRTRSFVRGDLLRLNTGASFLLQAGSVGLTHNGAVVDVTQGRVVPSGADLTAGHRYLIGEDTSAQLTARSGLVKAGMQGAYQLEESGAAAAPFVDVSDRDWYRQAVDFVYANRLFNGMGNDCFSPQSKMDRAMMMTVLYHLAGSPEEERLAATATFTDVPKDQWYTTFVAWAADHHVSVGTGDGKFSPLQPVTRQQVVVLLYNFAINYLHMDLNERADLSACTDRAQIAFWAEEPVSWALASGVMALSAQGTVEPERSATRAEVASMLMNFSQRYLG